jgi:D-glycero-alpha-D-manno-heptose 1-phosphate guanylyltransferase
LANKNQEIEDFHKAPNRGLNGIVVKEAIVLAGGLGTRLKEAVPDVPKCMAPVAGRPFLFYVINYLRSQGIEKFIFSLGYKHEMIEAYLETQFTTLAYQCVIEAEPLGTGGALLLALQKATTENVVVVNGDTLYKGQIIPAADFHFKCQAECTLLLQPMVNFDRYGVVATNDKGQIINFSEKQFYPSGNINAGVYLINKSALLSKQLPIKFSFEKDYLEQFYDKGEIVGIVQHNYFIDIGIPEDFNRAQHELATATLSVDKIDKSWTLFLDRDGVINHDKIGSYILNAVEFEFMDGAPDLFKKLSALFGRIIVVTNQRGVGRGLMTVADLKGIHQKMINAVTGVGGHIDAIYYAPAIVNNDADRKPNPGMAFKAKQDFPAIDFSKAIMVGNKMSDMQFGKNAGMYTVYVATTNPEAPYPHVDVDLRFANLNEFVKAL